jgi:hypothetical protein
MIKKFSISFDNDPESIPFAVKAENEEEAVKDLINCAPWLFEHEDQTLRVEEIIEAPQKVFIVSTNLIIKAKEEV